MPPAAGSAADLGGTAVQAKDFWGTTTQPGSTTGQKVYQTETGPTASGGAIKYTEQQIRPSLGLLDNAVDPTKLNETSPPGPATTYKRMGAV